LSVRFFSLDRRRTIYQLDEAGGACRRCQAVQAEVAQEDQVLAMFQQVAVNLPPKNPRTNCPSGS